MVSGSGHTVAIAFVRSAVQAVPVARRAALLAGCGIAPSLLAQSQARVPAAAFGALWMAVAQALDDEFFGLDTRRMKPGSFALLCHGLMGQPSVERALHQAARGFALFLDDLEVSLETEGSPTAETRHPSSRPAAAISTTPLSCEVPAAMPRTTARLIVRRRAGAPRRSPDARRFADETMLVMLHGLLCWLAGRRVPLLAMHLAHARPAHAAEYTRMFCQNLHFQAAASSIAFDPRVLAAKPATTSASLRAFLRDAPQSVFLKQVAGTALAERVRRRLRSAPPWPTLESVAGQWAMSPATLRRRLQDEGTGWADLKDQIRRDRAIHLLARGGTALAEVAEQLGFEDVSSFHRAFRRWTGAAPGRYRAQGGDPTAP